jgi:DNA polymerase I
MPVPYTYIKDATEAERLCQRLLKEKAVGIDWETTGLDPHTKQVTLASFSDKDQNTWVVDTRNKNNLLIFKPLLEAEDIVKLSHNALFEYMMAKGTAKIDTENLICTLLGERCLTAGKQFGGLDLATVAMKYLGIEMDKDLQKSFIDYTGEFSTDQLEYAAFDSYVMFPLAGKIKEAAREAGVFNIWYHTECPAIQAWGDIMFYGQKIDVAAWKKTMTENEERAKVAKVTLDRWFEPVCDKEWSLEPGREGEQVISINYDSQPEVLYKLQQLGIKVDGETIQNTNKKTQNKIKDLEIIRALTAYRSATKLTGTYGQTYLDAIHPDTGRIHFNVNPYGTDTGRPTCREGLNCLNIPRDKRYRDAFITDPDRLISTVDYSGAELVILAELSGDQLMIDGFNSGVDFHCYVASLLLGVEVTKTNDNSHFRNPAKTLNFGIAYGMSPFSLYEKLVYELGHKITLEECEDLFDKYNATFSQAIKWLKAQQRFASSQFVMHNMNGRTRHWFAPNLDKITVLAKKELSQNGRIILTDHQIDYELPQLILKLKKGQLRAIEREGANCQIQTVNADMTKNSMAAIRHEIKRRRFDARMYNSVYDEIVIDVHKSCAEEVHELQKEIMIKEANKMLTKVKMKVEGTLSPHWAK